MKRGIHINTDYFSPNFCYVHLLTFWRMSLLTAMKIIGNRSILPLIYCFLIYLMMNCMIIWIPFVANIIISIMIMIILIAMHLSGVATTYAMSIVICGIKIIFTMKQSHRVSILQSIIKISWDRFCTTLLRWHKYNHVSKKIRFWQWYFCESE